MMMKKLLILLLALLPLHLLAQSLQVAALKCEYKTDLQGVESEKPDLSWQLKSNRRGIMQAAYRVLVSDNADELARNKGTCWDSEKVNSDASIQVYYAGKPLKASRTYYWKVMVWDNRGEKSAWSKTGTWQMGLATPGDWDGAKWIAYDQLPDSQRIVPFIHLRGPKKMPPANDVLPLLRKKFTLDKSLRKATLYISGLGHFELSINGKKVGDHFLDPGWTYYDKQVLYVPFDVTNELVQGQNAIGVMLGNGFYYIPRDKRYRKLTGMFGYPKMICRLVMEYTDGSTGSLVSDESWKAAPGPITFSSIYGGEDYNANLEQQGWDTPGFDDTQWQNAITIKNGPALNAQIADPLKVFQVFAAKKITQSAPNQWVYDFGQNASGIPRVKVKGHKGDTVRLWPAELINADGSINQKGSGSPYYDTYVLKGDGAETWQPRFTYYGFRYVGVQGAVPQGKPNPTNKPEIEELQELHTHNAAPATGDFNCSNELFNKTFTLIDWAMRSNMASLFTDCPTREKLGWLEQDHLVGSSLRYNYDIANLSRKCIEDMRLAQTEDGLIPEIAPEYVNFGDVFRDSPEWGSNAIIFPWYVYQWYGDKQVLANSYDMMKRYLGYLAGKANDHILTQGLGDWYDIGPKGPGFSQNTTKGITATAIYYYDLDIVAKVARLLGKTGEAVAFEKLAMDVRSAFNKTFFNPQTKQYGTGSQAANAMAIYMQLVDPKDKQAVVENIVADIRKHNNGLTAGDIGYRYLLKVLDDAGRSDVIFDMNNRSDVPGYGYQLAKGATALTEAWDALPTSSNNHFMLGHIMEWFYGGLAGIRQQPGDVAFKHIEIRPQPVGNVTYARASYQSPYGKISTNWKKTGKQFQLEATIPPNTTALVYLPAAKSARISEGGASIGKNKDIKYTGYKFGMHCLEVGSGAYHFVAQ